MFISCLYKQLIGAPFHLLVSGTILLTDGKHPPGLQSDYLCNMLINYVGTKKCHFENRRSKMSIPFYDYVLIPLNLIGLPVYIILLLNIVKHRKIQPFSSSFSKLVFCCGLFDIVHILNSYSSIKPAYWGWLVDEVRKCSK